MPGQEWSRGFAEDKERRLVRKHLPYSQGLTVIIVISWWFVMIMLMMSLCPNSWWWCCLRSSVGACDDGDVAINWGSVLQSKLHSHWQRQTSSQSFACPNDNISPENLLPPPVYTAQVTIITNHLSICLQFRWTFVQGRTFDFCWKTVSVEFSLRKHPKLLPIADFLRRSQRSFALSQVRAFSKNQFWIHSHTNLLK